MRISILAAYLLALFGCGGSLEDATSTSGWVKPREGITTSYAQSETLTQVQSEPKQMVDIVGALNQPICIPGACVQFGAQGDYLYVDDTKSDGYSAVGQIDDHGTCWNNTGTRKVCDFDIAETIIYIRACIGDYSTKHVHGCSSWKPTYAPN